MKITFLGHAGLYIEAASATILCDPWFNPAYFGSWFPFPSNDHVDISAIRDPDFLYVSHLHYDHLDVTFLREQVSKETTVVLPDYPLAILEHRLRDLGFRRFLHTRNLQPIRLGDLRLALAAMVAPTDGPIGDSTLIVDDGVHRVLNQNDSRPIDIEQIAAMGPFDAHLIQYSGAIWFPFVYAYPQRMIEALGRKKRENGMARALRYIEEFGARWVIPAAGPPCFLDEELFRHNDIERDPANVFPDQTVFLDYMRERKWENGLLALPGTTIELNDGPPQITHALDDTEIRRPFDSKREYLLEYRRRWWRRLEAEKAAWPRGRVDLLPALRDWFEPLLAKADITCAGVNGRVVLAFEEGCGIAIDFHRRCVERWDGGEWDYQFHLDPALVEHCVLVHAEDWVNEVFLSCRFEARRKGPYNEYVYNFFKALSMERLQYVEGFYAERSPIDQFWEADGYTIQRRCPHLKADLSRFGQITDGVLTCSLHGWQFELASGRCLTSDDHRLYARPQGDAGTAPPVLQPTPGAAVRARCGHCWYDPAHFPEGGPDRAKRGRGPGEVRW